MHRNMVIVLLVMALLVCGNEGKWCVGWGKSGEKATKRFPCAFSAYDGNGDGKITKKEFQLAVKGHEREASEIVFTILDTNDDGIVGQSEFTNNSLKLIKIHLLEKCKKFLHFLTHFHPYEPEPEPDYSTDFHFWP